MSKKKKHQSSSKPKQITVEEAIAEVEGMEGGAVATVPKDVPEDDEEQKADKYAKTESVFEFVLLSYNKKLPGEPGYKKEEDEILRGFQMSHSVIPLHLRGEVKSVNEVTAYDFLTSPYTGMRRGETKPPSGAVTIALPEKISDWNTLPPLFVWKQGMWLSSLIDDADFDLGVLSDPMQAKVKAALVQKKELKGKVPADIYPYYVVSGEGTPGNYKYRIYELPGKYAGDTQPHHPLNWPKNPEPKSASSFLWGDHEPPAPKSLATPKASTGLPFGVKARCAGCGHWYKIDDLVGHSKLCPREEEQDFAVMCADGCGCTTLDQAAKRKPGFPRAITKPPEVPTEVQEKPLDLMTKAELMVKGQSMGLTIPSSFSKGLVFARVQEAMQEKQTHDAASPA